MIKINKNNNNHLSQKYTFFHRTFREQLLRFLFKILIHWCICNHHTCASLFHIIIFHFIFIYYYFIHVVTFVSLHLITFHFIFISHFNSLFIWFSFQFLFISHFISHFNSLFISFSILLTFHSHLSTSFHSCIIVHFICVIS